jgi:hypothetical protein
MSFTDKFLGNHGISAYGYDDDYSDDVTRCMDKARGGR